jgi:beta-glucanase (GH16 family)
MDLTANLPSTRRIFLRTAAAFSLSCLAAPGMTFAQKMTPMLKRSPTEAEKNAVHEYHVRGAKVLFEDGFQSQAAFEKNWTVFTDDRSDLLACRTAKTLSITDDGLKIETVKADHCKEQWSTGQIISKQAFRYGLYEAYMKIAPSVGVDNAFWLTSQGDLNDGTGDSFEIDVAETYYPALVRSTLHRHNLHGGGDRYETGFDDRLKGNLAAGFHDYGVLWTPEALVLSLDGVAFQTIEMKGTINVPANLRLSTALGNFGGKSPADPVGLVMQVSHVRVLGL